MQRRPATRRHGQEQSGEASRPIELRGPSSASEWPGPLRDQASRPWWSTQWARKEPLEINRDKKQLPEELKKGATTCCAQPYPDLRKKADGRLPAARQARSEEAAEHRTSWRRARATPHAARATLAGRSLKGETQCLKCHSVRGVGGNIGPDLSMIGKKASRENLFESILYPSKAVADQYVAWQIETKKGVTMTVASSSQRLPAPHRPPRRQRRGQRGSTARTLTRGQARIPNSLMLNDIVVYLSEAGIDGRGRISANAEDAGAETGFMADRRQPENGPDGWPGTEEKRFHRHGIDLNTLTGDGIGVVIGGPSYVGTAVTAS